MRRQRASLKLRDFLLIILVFLICIVVVEGFFFLVNRYRTQVAVDEWKVSTNPFEYSGALGYRPRPNLHFSAFHKVNNRVSYDAAYTIDEYGRRLTPGLNEWGKDFFILFFGCSFTFGEGLQDNETLPFYVSEYAGRYRAYNYGFLGYGTQQMLEHLKRSAIQSEIKEKDGAAVYTFIDDHIYRVIGSLRVVNSWGESLPFYLFDDKGHAVRNGTFLTGRPIVSLLYEVINKSETIRYMNRYINMDIPRIREDHIQLTAALIEESRNLFREKFHSNKFYVVIFPGSYYGKRLLPYLHRAGILCFDYSQLFDFARPDFHIAGDLHPNARAYKILAQKLTQDIGISNAPDTQ